MSDLITLVDLLQPICSRTYGTAPCTASLGVTGSAKCYNTRATCQDQANYSETTLTLRFARSQEGIAQYGNVLPCLTGISITPLSINVGGMDTSMSAFGRRETAQITLQDFRHSDLLVDPYRTERHTGAAGDVFIPYDSGSFWGKWVARNPYFESMSLIVRQGLLGDDISAMDIRHYVVSGVTGPNDGVVQITAKDLFSLIEGRKAKAPRASRGELRLGITDTHTGTLEIVPPEIADEDYPTGDQWVAIGEEIISVSRGTGEAVFQILGRGEFGTDADEHDTGDKVQTVLHYDSWQAQMIVDDLLTRFSEIPAGAIDRPAWDTEMASRPEQLSAFIAEPTEVQTLIGELAEQAGFTIWPNVATNKIEFRVLAPDPSPAPTVNDAHWILQSSYSSKPQINQRCSQVWVYYGQRNPLMAVDDESNYRSRRIFADLESETFYGSAAIRKVFSRWIPQFAGSFAIACGSRLLAMFRDPPLRASFALHHRRSRDLELAEQFLLQARDDQTVHGAQNTRTMIPFELHRVDEKVIVQAMEARFWEVDTTTRLILIDSNTTDFNMRDRYEQLYGVPGAGVVVTFRVGAGIKVGSTSPFVAALSTGAWPADTELRLEILAGGKVLGKGGDGGVPTGQINGQQGGPALDVAAALVVSNLGTIAGGGGGGGGAKDSVFAMATGGGGAGYIVGDGHVDGTETLGGAGQVVSSYDASVKQNVLATAGKGGDLGQPGVDGAYGGNGSTVDAGTGGAAGAAIVGAGFVYFEAEGTIIGERSDALSTVIDPPPSVPTSVQLSLELALASSGNHTTTMVLSFTMPNDTRIVGFEAQVQSPRSPGVWRPLFFQYVNRWEWQSSEIGTHRVRVRSVYVRGAVSSAWVQATVVNQGTLQSLTTIGLASPLNPKLFISAPRNSSLAKVRIQAGFSEDATVLPDRLLVFYSTAAMPNRVLVTNDAGAKLYIDPQSAIISTKEVAAAAGSTVSTVKFTNPGTVNPALMGYWWANIDDGVSPYVAFKKVVDADDSTLYLAPGEEFPYVADPGDTVTIVESSFADPRSADFRFVAAVDYSNPAASAVEVIKHDGVQFDGLYYIAATTRGAEGTTQANQTGKYLHYFAAPGALTNVLEIPASSFAVVDGVATFLGDVPITLAGPITWLSISCCFARMASDGKTTSLVRSNIVHLPVAGAA